MPALSGKQKETGTPHELRNNHLTIRWEERQMSNDTNRANPRSSHVQDNSNFSPPGSTGSMEIYQIMTTTGCVLHCGQKKLQCSSRYTDVHPEEAVR